MVFSFFWGSYEAAYKHLDKSIGKRIGTQARILKYKNKMFIVDDLYFFLQRNAQRENINIQINNNIRALPLHSDYINHSPSMTRCIVYFTDVRWKLQAIELNKRVMLNIFRLRHSARIRHRANLGTRGIWEAIFIVSQNGPIKVLQL